MLLNVNSHPVLKGDVNLLLLSAGNLQKGGSERPASSGESNYGAAKVHFNISIVPKVVE